MIHLKIFILHVVERHTNEEGRKFLLSVKQKAYYVILAAVQSIGMVRWTLCVNNIPKQQLFSFLQKYLLWHENTDLLRIT